MILVVICVPVIKGQNGEFNPAYTSTFAFNNDFSAFKYLCRGEKELEEQEEQYAVPYNELLVAKPETGICRVICFSPRHDVTLAELGITDIIQVIKAWKKEFEILGKEDYINYIEIFENKGELMDVVIPIHMDRFGLKKPFPLSLSRNRITN